MAWAAPGKAAHGDRAGQRPASAELTLGDVLDLRAYERVREDYRAKIIARKRDRRVALGPVMTLVFECFDTVRFQVQEMARAEKIISDGAAADPRKDAVKGRHFPERFDPRRIAARRKLEHGVFADHRDGLVF